MISSGSFVGGIFSVGKHDLVPELYHVNGADLSAVAADAVGEPLQPYQHTVGNTLVPPEKLLRGHGLGEMHGEPEFSQRNHVLSHKNENRGKNRRSRIRKVTPH